MQMLVQIGQIIKAPGMTKLTNGMTKEPRVGSITMPQVRLQLSWIHSWQARHKIAFVVDTQLAQRDFVFRP